MTKMDVVKTILLLIGRFPNFPISCVRHQQNFIGTIQQALDIVSADPNNFKSHDDQENLSLRIDYLADESYRYDQVRLDKLKSSLQDDHQTLISYIPRFVNLTEDIHSIKDKHKHFNKVAKLIIRLSPFIYNVEGEHTAFNQQQFNEIDAPSLQALYTDTFTEHLAPMYASLANTKGLGEVHKITRNILNQFIKKDVIPASSPYSDSNEISKESSLILEEIPSIYTPLRGVIASDCSMTTIPFFGLHKNARVFWIIRSHNENTKPAGYVFLIEQEVDGVVYPYVITINGSSVTEIDCKGIAHLLCTHYQVDKLYVADWGKNSALINYQAPRSFLSNIKHQEVQLQLPQNWDILKDYTQYTNYYSSTALQHACAIAFNNINIKIVRTYDAHFTNLYPPIEHTKNLKLSARAIIAYHFSKHYNDPSTTDEITQLLDIQHSHIDNIKPLINLNVHGELRLDGFHKLHQHFQFDLEDLAQLDIFISAPLLRQIYDQHQELFNESDWKKLCVSSFNHIHDIIKTDNLGTNELDNFKDYLSSIPDIYITQYWEALEPLLFLRDSTHPDNYIIRRFIKYFTSYGTIELFLNFLHQYPDVIEASSANDTRWFELFQRAIALSPRFEHIDEVLNRFYYQRSLNKNGNWAYYELAQCYHFGTSLGIEEEQWLEDIIKQQEFSAETETEFRSYIDELAE